MASVHESLYFNPMMTNGVVHANVFGIKDWVTPYKISVLALLYDMTVSKVSFPERRRLNKLILPLQQVSVIRSDPRLAAEHVLMTVFCVWSGSGPQSGALPKHCGWMQPPVCICSQTQVICLFIILIGSPESPVGLSLLPVFRNMFHVTVKLDVGDFQWQRGHFFPFKVMWDGRRRTEGHGVFLLHPPDSVCCFWIWGL